MNCKRCGRSNPNNAQQCAYCGTPLSVSNKKSNQKQTESIIVALIIILVLLLVVVSGFYIYKNNNSHNIGLGSGGGSSSPPSTLSSRKKDSSAISNNTDIADEQNESELSTEQLEQTEESNSSNEKLSKKDMFLAKADDIESYSQTYLDTAESQSEINNESRIVYQKWDALLNEVYQYLKTILSDDDFKQLQKDEEEWIKQKELAIEEAGAEWEGGSGEPMARNFVAIQYTEERCYYLISLIN